MRLKRSVIEKICYEELTAHLGRMLGESPIDPDVEDASGESDPKKKQKPTDPADPKVKQQQKKPPQQKASAKPAEPNDADLGGDGSKPQPDEQEPEVEPTDGQDARGSGKVADAVVGKTVQSITMEPRSKVLPGAQEIVVSFDQVPDPLKILITKTGAVKFFFKGSLHNIL